jgi:hypothetical protein
MFALKRLELEFVGLQLRAMKRQMERRREFEWRDANASIASASDATIIGLPWSALELPQRPSRPYWSARLDGCHGTGTNEGLSQ